MGLFIPPSIQFLQVLLEQLPTVGDVTVVRGAAPSGFSNGFTWTVTFETQIDNLPDLSVDGVNAPISISPSVGSEDVQLSVVEVQRGEPPSFSLDLDGLEPGEAYVTRVSAINADGQGPTTIAAAPDGGDRGSNNDGLGIVPFEVVARAAPQAPLIAGITAVSASQLEVTLEAPTDTVGFDVLGYKVRAKLHVPCVLHGRLGSAVEKDGVAAAHAAGQVELYFLSFV